MAQGSATGAREDDAEQSEPGGDIETRAQKKARIAKERAVKKAMSEKAKLEKELERENKRLERIQERIDAGETKEDIEHDERMTKLCSEASAEVKRYSNLLLTAGQTVKAIERGKGVWKDMKDRGV